MASWRGGGGGRQIGEAMRVLEKACYLKRVLKLLIRTVYQIEVNEINYHYQGGDC